MEAERVILKEMDPEFRSRIIDLKNEGFKTEPAFAKLLGLEGDPYLSIIQYVFDMTRDPMFDPKSF